MSNLPTLTLPLTQTPPFVLLALAKFNGASVQWVEANEQSEATYGDIKGSEAVRAELEKGIPGKEVGLPGVFLLLFLFLLLAFGLFRLSLESHPSRLDYFLAPKHAIPVLLISCT